MWKQDDVSYSAEKLETGKTPITLNKDTWSYWGLARPPESIVRDGLNTNGQLPWWTPDGTDIPLGWRVT